MQIKGQWQAGMWLQAILVSTSPKALIQASDSQFVFLHKLFRPSFGWDKTSWGKNSLPWELTQLGARCNFCGSGSSVAKSNLWIIIYKRQPTSELFALYLVSPYVDKLLWKHAWAQIEEKVNKMLRMWPTEWKPAKCLLASREVGFFSCLYVDKNHFKHAGP